MRNCTLLKTTILFAVLTFIGCTNEDARTYRYQPMDGVTFTIQTINVEYYPTNKSVFLYFELMVNNQSSSEVSIDVGQIQASLNGVQSIATHFDSLASVMSEKEALKKGQSLYKLYFVFPEELRGQKVEEFKVLNFALASE